MTAAELAERGGTSVGSMLADGAAWLSTYMRGESLAAGSTTRRRVEGIETLRRGLETGPILKEPELRTIRGVFYPAVLLSPGLWERDEEDSRKFAWRDPLQQWLFSGFVEWAPSWDLNTTDGAGRDRPFFGQIGYTDEAFSLLVAISGEEAPSVRRRLLGQDEMVCNVEVTGTLVHRRHAGPIKQSMRPWGKTFDYCLRVDLGEDGHRIERTDEDDPYSGYLWQCVAPKDWLAGTPAIRDVFFLWEHTDLASRSARDYGVAALAHKYSYVEERFGELEVVQKSTDALPGTPLLETDSFFAMIG
jgi:hypothetical protein